jgi:hypothetical protein
MTRMTPSRLSLVVVLALAACATVVTEDAERTARFSFGIWGDMPYVTSNGPDVESPRIPALIADMNAAKLAFAVFIGDLKSGGSLCTDDVYAAAVGRFNTFSGPMIYVPGDNEWTDCHRTNNGGYDALERLTFLRRTMFATLDSFGQRPVRLERQGPPGGVYAENTRWTHGQVVFVALNVPGSNNNKVGAADRLSAKSARTHWVKVTVDPRSRNVFTFEPMIVPGSR